MLNFYAKIIWTSTTLVPVLIVYAVLAALEDDLTLSLIFATVTTVQVGCFIWIWRYQTRKFERFEFSVTKAKTADRESFGFVILYLLPLFRTSIDKIDWLAFSLVVVVFTLIISAGYHYHFNPILRLMRWHFYNVETPEGITYVLITKSELRSMNEHQGQSTFSVTQLTEYVIVDIGEDNH